MKRLIGSAQIGVAVLLLTLGLSACSGNSSNDSDNNSSGGDTLVVATPNSPEGLDHDVFYSEAAQQARTFLYDNLLGYKYTDQDGLGIPGTEADQLEGRLAESWELSEDQKTLTLHLRRGVMSHAGNELTADDVQYTWDRGWDDQVNGSSKFYASVDLGITEPSWKVVDKYTWQITVPKPNALLVPMMANNDLNIYDSTEMKKHATSDDPWATKWAVTGDAGFGPYTLKEWSPGSQVVVSAFKDYYRGSPAYSTIVYKTIPDGAQRAQLVSSGQVDMAEYLPPSNLDALKTNSAVNLLNTEGNAVLRLTMNNKQGPLQDPRVRLALNLAIDRSAIAEGIYFGFAKPLQGIVGSGVTGLNPNFAYTVDVEKAKSLLAEAGVADGFDFQITYNTSKASQQQVAQAISDSLDAIGVKTTLNPVSAATFNSKFYSGTYQAALATEWPIIPDIGYSLALVYPCDSPFDPSLYCNKQVDQLIQDGLGTVDPDARQKVWDQVQQILMQDDPADAALIEPGWQIVTKKDISNVSWLPWQSWDPFEVK